MLSSTKKRVGVIRGGIGEHYATSLKQGGDIILHILENLSEKYKTFDILIDKKGVWNVNGLPIIPADLSRKIDVVWNTTHPSVLMILENLSIPNIGGSSFSHTLENSREMLKEHMARVGVSMPRSIILPVYQKDFDGPRERYAIKKAKEVFEKFSSPWVVKSFTPDLNMGIHLAKTFNELVAGIEDGVKHEKSILVEEFITDKIASVHSVPQFRGQDIYTFPLGDFMSIEKVSTRVRIPTEIGEKLTALAKKLHTHLGANYYSKLDFVVNSKGKVFLLDFESIPDLKPNSHFSQICESVGAKMHQVVEHILEQV